MSYFDTATHSHRSKSLGRPVSLFTRLALWRSRRALAQLDARALKDIGVSPEQANREAALTVWDVPASWTSR